MVGTMGNNTTSLKVMSNTLHFQASYVGDQNESYERFAKEVSEHMKESTGVSRAQREASQAAKEVIEEANERITRRRKEINDLDTLVGCLYRLPL